MTSGEQGWTLEEFRADLARLEEELKAAGARPEHRAHIRRVRANGWRAITIRRAGDMLITPKGSKATWRALSPVKKFREPEPN